MSKSEQIVVAFAGLTICFLITIVLAARTELQNSELRTQAAERGYAEYCLPHGEWAWIGECEE